MSSALDFLPFQQRPPATTYAAPQRSSSAAPTSGIGIGNPYGPLGTDPGLVAAQQAQATARAAAAAQLRQLRSQALIQFGDPSLLKGLGFGIDPNTAKAAGANQFSVVNLLRQADTDAKRGIVNNLAARGLIRSGDYGYLHEQEAKQYAQQLNAAEQAVLQALSGYASDYLSANQSADASFNSALGDAWNRYASNPDPNIYGYWTHPTQNAPTPYQYVPSPYIDPNGSGQSLITMPGYFK